MQRFLRRTWLTAALVGAMAVPSLLPAQADQPRAPLRDQRHEVEVYVPSWKELQRRNIVMQTRDYSCGAAALATVLRYYWGDPVGEDDVLDSPPENPHARGNQGPLQARPGHQRPAARGGRHGLSLNDRNHFAATVVPSPRPRGCRPEDQGVRPLRRLSGDVRRPGLPGRSDPRQRAADDPRVQRAMAKERDSRGGQTGYDAAAAIRR